MSAKNAILKALLEGAITDLMVATNVENVMVNANTTLAAKLAEIIASLNNKASKDSLSGYVTTTEFSEGLSSKSDVGHGHAQSDITGMSDITSKLANTPTNDEVDAKIAAAIADLINGAPATYDTLKEISDYISANNEVVDALTAAIGNKADASVVASIKATVDVLGALAMLNEVSESNLDAALKQKVNAASAGNHTHSNKTTLDGITDAKVAAWNSKGRFYASATQPSNLTEYDLWAQIVN